MSETLLIVAAVATVAGLACGALVGAWVGHQRPANLVDLARPSRYRAVRGALIGTVFGGVVIPKVAVLIYVLMAVALR